MASAPHVLRHLRLDLNTCVCIALPRVGESSVSEHARSNEDPCMEAQADGTRRQGEGHESAALQSPRWLLGGWMHESVRCSTVP
mmetsp:Transcript_1702/g.10496  ORF Transcript_1702/g.10496 Transcript_1702/m.10496 type:complete len:84 (+) Transcript_1702:1506-1757(+)